MPNMNIDLIRQQIPTCQNMVYVNTGWSGPSPRSVIDATVDRLEYENLNGPTCPEVYESSKEIDGQLKAEVGALLNASPDEICLTHNTTDGLNIVINGISWQPGDEIVTCNLEHSSVLVPSYYQRHRHGVDVKVLEVGPGDDKASILTKFEDAVTSKTRLIFISHIEYFCGLRMPVKEIRAMSRGFGTMLLLDGAQAAGHIALDVKDIDCDFYSIAGQKWLLGPEGTGALYIKKDMIPQIQPVKVAGRAVVSRETPYEFEPLTDSIDKFIITSHSSPLRAGMLQAVKYVRDAGLEDIEAKDLRLAATLKSLLSEIPGAKVLSSLEPGTSSGLVTFTLEGWEPEKVVAHLWGQHRIICRQVSYHRCVRASLHFFNTEDEVEAFAQAVRGLAK